VARLCFDLGPAATIAQALAAFPQFGNIDTLRTRWQRSYNGLQTSLQKRFSNGLTFLVALHSPRQSEMFDSNIGWQSGAENAVFGGLLLSRLLQHESAAFPVTTRTFAQLKLLAIPMSFLSARARSSQTVRRRREDRRGWKDERHPALPERTAYSHRYDAFGSSTPIMQRTVSASVPDVVPGQPLMNLGV